MSGVFDHLTPEGRKFFRELRELERMQVEVGFHEDTEPYEDGMTVAGVAAINELGASNLPARPFMRQSFERHEDELMDACERVNAALVRGGSVEKALKELGVFAKGIVQEEIVSGGFAPNAPSTIERKGSAQPLIDTSHMRQSVNYKIKKG